MNSPQDIDTDIDIYMTVIPVSVFFYIISYSRISLFFHRLPKLPVQCTLNGPGTWHTAQIPRLPNLPIAIKMPRTNWTILATIQKHHKYPLKCYIYECQFKGFNVKSPWALYFYHYNCHKYAYFISAVWKYGDTLLLIC